MKSSGRKRQREGKSRRGKESEESPETLCFSIFFEWFVGREGPKVGSLKRRVRSHLARWEMKNCTLLWHEARFRVKMYNTHHVRSTFGSWEFQKLHAAVARSTFSIQNVKKARGSEHFWKLGPVKIACHCGSNHFQDFPSLNLKKPSLSDHLWKLGRPKLWWNVDFCMLVWCSGLGGIRCPGSEGRIGTFSRTPLQQSAHFVTPDVVVFLRFATQGRAGLRSLLAFCNSGSRWFV